MGEHSEIAWTDSTFNAWIGCAKVSAGCRNCYASVDTFARRSRANGLELWGEGAARHVTSDAYWRQPLKWNREATMAGVRRRVFCASLSDVFEDRRDLDPVRARLWALIAETRALCWLLLTKRPEHADRLWGVAHDDMVRAGGDTGGVVWRPNVWIGTTVDDRQHGIPRIEHLRAIPAAVRFLSIEPQVENLVELDMRGIHWAIMGGESGPRARPYDLAWPRDIIRQCRAAGVAPFVKQLGAQPFEHLTADGGYRVGLVDRAGRDWSEWPEDLRVREFPRGAAR